jgi:hypothetical protein
MAATSLRVFLGVLFLLLLGTTTVQAGDRFVDNGNGTVTDTQLKLLWAKKDTGKPISFLEAEKMVNYNFKYTLKLPYEVNQKYGYWRLPTLEELRSLLVQNPAFRGKDVACGTRSFIHPVFSTSCVLLWSSDESLGSHMAFNFNNREAFAIEQWDFEDCRVLPVRSLK